jgi:hypothetical protein
VIAAVIARHRVDDKAAADSAARAGRRAGAFKVLARQSLALAITFLTFSTDILPRMKMSLNREASSQSRQSCDLGSGRPAARWR